MSRQEISGGRYLLSTIKIGFTFFNKIVKRFDYPLIIF